MADNIKIVGSILGTSQVSRYTNDDLRLITSLKVKKSFSTFSDYIEYHVYDADGQLLENNYNYRNYKLPTSFPLNPGTTPDTNVNNTTATGAEVGSVSNLTTTSSTYPIIEIDPVQDLQDAGYSSGEFKVQYNVFKNKISKYPNAELFIKEISADRTELRVGSVILTNAQIETGSLSLINTYNSSSVFDPFLLNFDGNKQAIATNIVLNKVDSGYEILFKLYEELDSSIAEKSSLWVVEEISTPYIFDINLDALISGPVEKKLKGPNFNNISRFGLNTTTTPYLNNFSNNQEGLFSLNESQSIDINVNYNSISGENGGFNSFVTFGSAVSRIENFYTKVKQIETYNNFINRNKPNISTTSSLQSEINSYSASINTIISNFDGFENYLYFESGSLTSSFQYGITPFPKVNSNKPYVLLSPTSSNAIVWYNAATGSAEDYDSNNVNYFKYSVPGYLVDDPSNENYLTFLNMMGQYFDNIWVYITSITDRNLANNNLNLGVSKDVVYSLLQSLGISIFNSFGDQNIANYLLGANTGSATYNGYLTDFSATSSYLNNIPKKDILAESYKRIYHNLPLLLQRKGTVAGLRTLISTFGILNQDYYSKIDNLSGSYVGGKLITSSLFVTNSYYTPTGSTIFSSILNIKEYGGSTTEGLLKGYNNEKVRIISNVTASVSGTIGNTLSPYTSVMQYTTASSNFRTVDDNYVDISFSPQTQIDTYISKSISSVNTNWLIDDYIGNPQQQYSGSYIDLNAQRKTYFVNGTGSYAGFTSSIYVMPDGKRSNIPSGSDFKEESVLDYNGFIRLIQFFDNSIFKMLEENVPARTNLSTGVTINSPVLERNKWSYARTSDTSKEPEKDGKIDKIDFTPVYNDFYYNLSGSREAYFSGELSGSRLDVKLNSNNPYLNRLSTDNALNSPNSLSASIYIQNFLNSDFNVMLNNVSESLYSVSRKKLEISGSTGLIGGNSTILLLPTSLQDSYLSLSAYTSPRYDGTKVYSAKYNTYTDGDKSFGKSAAIDKYVRKFGLFTQIVSSSFFVSRNLTALKYLVDESGSLTELSQTSTSSLDSHWAEVQNTFGLGSTATVGLFDNQQYSNQKTTDGPKTIFDSGYSYYPILYYTGSDAKLYFQYVGKGTGILMQANNGAFFIQGSTDNRYPSSSFSGTTSSINAIFDTLDSNFSIGNSYYSNIRRGQTNSFPTYSISQNTNMAFSSNFGINVQFPTANQSVTYQFDLLYNQSGSAASSSIGSQTQTFSSTAGALSTTLTFNVTSSFRDFIPGDRVFFRLLQYNASASLTSSLTSTGDGTSFSGLKNTLQSSNINPNAITSSGQFISGSNNVDTFVLNQSISSFIDYQYLPATSSVSLHNDYGNVDYTFSPKVGDVLLVYYNNNSQYQEFNISRVTPGTKLSLTVTPNLVTNLASGSYIPNQINKVLLLSKTPDETNLNLTFDKIDGQTSYGFIIPDNLSPDVLKNIDVITRQVKQKLLSSGNAI
jgi:hypothetical protein